MSAWETLPGETPIDDISGLKVKGITTRAQLNLLEAANIRKALVKYLGKRPTRKTAKFDLSWAVRLHREMFGNVWTWAGTFRTSDVNIGIRWEHVETSLYTLLENLLVWDRSGMGLLEQAVRLHHRAVFIHPFYGGNGRWSRLLANIWLKLHRHALTRWPEELVGASSPIRSEYIAAIKSADQGDYDPLMELHKRFTPET